MGGASKDRQAGYGRAARGMGRGCKIHALAAADGGVASWRLAAMNVDEREIARRMLRKPSLQGYVLADANDDSNELHGLCDALGDRQLVAPRRYGPKGGWGAASRRPGGCGRRNCWRTGPIRSAGPCTRRGGRWSGSSAT
ncbi:MAG: hypothetical protein ACRC1K_09945 [Planctomycetia bacterium]